MQKRIHDSYEMFDLTGLINTLLRYRWQHECMIIPGYQPDGNGFVKCVIMHDNKHDQRQFLRDSKGVAGSFWDVYGDDFGTPEQALIVLSQAPPPVFVDSVIPTWGAPYVEQRG